MKINAHTRLNAVIGNPIRHSESPRLHQALYEEMGINAVMLAIENPNLPEYMKSIRTLHIGLTAVTMPFKTAVLDYVDTQSDAVKALGAANTLLYSNGCIHAENTDAHGIRVALANTALKDKNVLILGAGGAARAVAYVLAQSDAHCFYLNRTQAKAEILEKMFGGRTITQGDVSSLSMDVIINATPDDSPLPGYVFKPHQTVFDLVYTPRETPLLREAQLAGATCISGIEMFVAQAREQAQLFAQLISTQEVLL